MSAQQSNSGDSGTLGIGGPTSGEQGSTPTHETMAETGGSGGGEQQARPTGARHSGQPGSKQAATQDAQPEGAGTDATATGPGAQDTRSQQAGIKPTGLGTPETGGNQSADDLAPPRKS